MKPERRVSPAFAVRMEVKFCDLGLMGYGEAHAIQLRCVDDQHHNADAQETILLVEHPPVFTLGRGGSNASLLMTREEIEAKGAEIRNVERGGDVTFHGPGQLVVYPIINLRKRTLSVTDFISALEGFMLETAADFGVAACRDRRNRGIWVGDNKIGSVGIRIRHGISFHGLALNVNLTIEPFSWIQPCGLQGVGVTSLELERKETIALAEVKAQMRSHLAEYFGVEP